MNYSIITPFIIPEEFHNCKELNIGDGFILNSIRELMVPHKCEYIFSSRIPLTDLQIEKINTTKVLLLGMANQLHDDFTAIKGYSLEKLKRIKIPIIPFGIGIDGDKSHNKKMTENTKEILRYIHSKIEFSSWRCPDTIDYLNRNLPELSNKYLMTGCPVMYNTYKLENRSFGSIENPKTLICTFTIRYNDCYKREIKTIDFIANKYKEAEKYIVVHEYVLNPSFKYHFKKYFKYYAKCIFNRPNTDIHVINYALKRGFKLFIPSCVEECLNFYKMADMHIGSRVHAHLFCLSQGIPSFLTKVDERSVGFSKALGFPVCDPENLEKKMDFDFEIVRNNSLSHYQIMKKFIESINSLE